MNYLVAYPEEIQQQVCTLLKENRLAGVLRQKYSSGHDIRTDRSLYRYVLALKNNYIRHASSPSKVMFDNDLKVIQLAWIAHGNLQGSRWKTKGEE